VSGRWVSWLGLLTVIYPSPESAFMNTIAVAAALAADAPADAVSVFDRVTVVPSVAAWVLIASYGAVRYYSSLGEYTQGTGALTGKSEVPDPQP
jgi:hypothetical protein